MVLNLKIPTIPTVRKFDPDDLSSSTATQPQEVSLNLANVKFSSEHFQIQSLKPAWFRGKNDREKKRKNYRKEEDTRIIRLRQSAITSYFPRHRSNQFRPSPKNNRPSPEVSLDIIRRVNNGVQVSGSPGLDTITRRDPVEPTPESTKGKRRDEMVETCAIPSFVPLTETYHSPFYSFYIP